MLDDKRFQGRKWSHQGLRSSTRTVADPAFGFGSRQSRGGENRRRGFAKTNPIFSAVSEAPLRAALEGENAKRG